ncbi:Endopeptidase La protein [Dioscorea alata]|uniref:Endopeptidase La protein n=1 Tax=Dioscorea alata TaxID=55571 RepID=A0ACB7W3I9_DIOAL|nr:Endopeptidase La protein [Dioscorea alata]
MQRLHLHLHLHLHPQFSMQSLRHLLLRLPKSKPYAVNPVSIVSLSSFSSFHSSHQRWNQEQNDENPKVWTFYDPLADQIVTTANGDDKCLAGDGEEKRTAGKNKKRDEDSLGSNSQAWSSMARRKPGKVKVSWVCENCGVTPGQWWGTCPSCQTLGSVKQFSESEVSRARGAEVSEAAMRSWLPKKLGNLAPQSLAEVNKGKNQSEWRIPLSGHFGMEVARVLGGGLVPGSLVLVGGDPGVGKSTLLLQLAAIIAQGLGYKGPAPVIYVSGEESIEQIANRADRMRITTGDLFLYSSTDIEDILYKIQPLSPQALIVDSIQTVYLRGVTGSAGNIMQVKECTSTLLRFAKQTDIPVLLIGHVTKTGDIAGPRILEHIVDTVLYMEGERYSSYRLLRSVKNRFGSTDELGVFEMSQSGLQAVSNPSEMFLSEHYTDSEVLAGLAITVIVDGSRAFVIEIQALCVSNSAATRQVNGVQLSRADMIISILMKQAGLKLQDHAIYLNVVSGFKLTETAGDVAIAAAICSSFLEFPIPNNVSFIGEIGLGGELRAVPRIDKRVMSVAKLGYKKCIVPKAVEKSLADLNLDIEIVGCRNLKEVINTIFQAR